MMRRFVVALAASALLIPAVLRADGPIPTDKQKKPPKKVITEDDLRSAGRPERGTVSGGAPNAPAEEKAGQAKEGAAAATSSEAKPEATESEKREARQKEIQAEIDYQAANIKSLQEQMDTAQRELNDLTDLTFSADGSTAGRRTALMRLVEDAGAQIKASRATIEQLEEQARREGVRVTVP